VANETMKVWKSGESCKKNGINLVHASPPPGIGSISTVCVCVLFVCWFICCREMGNQKSKGGGGEDAGAALEDVKKLSKIMHVSEKQLAKMQKSFKSQCKVRL
jgi:hypothetical protein